MGYVRHPNPALRDVDAILLRHRGLTLRQIADHLGCSTETVREALDPKLKARRNAERLARYHERQAMQ